MHPPVIRQYIFPYLFSLLNTLDALLPQIPSLLALLSLISILEILSMPPLLFHFPRLLAQASMESRLGEEDIWNPSINTRSKQLSSSKKFRNNVPNMKVKDMYIKSILKPSEALQQTTHTVIIPFWDRSPLLYSTFVCP